MDNNSRSFFAIQIDMDADETQVRHAVARILAAFNVGDDAPAAASTPAAQITPAEVAAAELDSDGLPWDARIHAGTKTKTQKGVWTQKKGVDEAVRDAVMAELRQQYPSATVAASVPTPTVAASVPTPTVAVSVPTPTVAVSVPAPTTPYAMLTDWLARNTGEGKQLTPAWVNQQFADNNTSLAALAANQELSAAWLEQFRTIGKQLGLPE